MLNYYSDPKEEQAIKEWAESKLSGISKLFEKQKVLISQGDHKEIFFVSDELMQVYKKMKDKHPFSIGFFFGEIGKGIGFSIETIQRYANITDNHKVVINRRFEQKFLHGRNPSSETVISFDPELKLGDFAVVCNSLDEALGFGIVTGDFRSRTRTQVIKNKMDRGWYLRHRE